MPDVSVIIPCYNHAHYLPYAVRSVLTQTFIDWEAIIVDDGSTDNTREVAAQFTDPRIRYIYQNNQGLSVARNTGIYAAGGTYLAFLDADDEWMPRFLEQCIVILKPQNDLAGVYTLNYLIDPQGNQLPQVGGEVVERGKLSERLLEGGFFVVHAVLLRAQILIEVGSFDTTLQGQGTEDWDLWIRVAQRHSMGGIPEPLACYRVYPGSMATNAGRMHANRMAVLTKHFGLPEGDPLNWPAEKRRGYAFAYRAAALGYIAQQEADQSWRFLAQAVAIEPGLLQRLDTFYELALGDQPRGYRGEASLVDIDANGVEMLRRMDALFAAAGPDVQALKGPAYGNAYLSLAMLCDQAGDRAAARRYVQRAIQAHPRLLRDPSIVRRLFKLSMGQRTVGGLQRLRKNLASQGAE